MKKPYLGPLMSFMKYNRFFVLLPIALLCFFVHSPSHAQVVIRDAEIESYMTQWFDPVFKANGMTPSQVNVVLVQNNDVNAFVAGGANIFFYTGLLELTDNPSEVIGVMAHELGHITGGHLVRSREAIERASYESILGSIIGVGAAILSGDGGAAATLGTGGNSLAQRRLLSQIRKYESSADQAALRSLNEANVNSTGLLTFMEKLLDQEALPASQQSEYVRTHPLTQNRVNSIRAGIEQNGEGPKIPDQWMEQHARMKAKLVGFIKPQQVLWTYNDRDQSIPARYARTIADYRQSQVDRALSGVDSLIASEPNNPYFYELKGQMLVEFGRLKEALPAYQKALSLAPGSGLIRIALSHTLIETAGKNKAQIEKAIQHLKRAARDEPRSSRVHRLLSTAYGRLGEDSIARLHLAEEAVLQRRISYAKQQANIALKGLKKGSTEWLRAKDILNYIEQKSGKG